MNGFTFEGCTVKSNRVIYTPSTFAKSSLLHLQEAGHLIANKPHTSSRLNLVSYLFFTVLSGCGSLNYAGKSYSLKKGDCVFIDCKHGYSHSTDKKLWELKWVHFYGSNMGEIYEKYIERGGLPVFTPKNAGFYSDTVDNILDVSNGNSGVKDMEIATLLTSLLASLMNDAVNTKPKKSGISEKQDIVSDIRNFLLENYSQNITLDLLSKRFYINKFYLSRIFKEKYGITVIGYLIKTRVNNAKILLRFTDNSIEEIAMKCGIYDNNYFSRVFKQIEGMSPNTYRNKWKK